MAELNEIYNFLALSKELLTSGQPSREQFQLVAEAGVETVINLALFTSTNALPDEEEVVTSLGMDYTHIPVVWEHPTEENLEEFFSAVQAQAGKKVLVHCAANMRVSAFVALYRILRQGWQHKKAFEDTYLIWDPFADPIWREFIESVLAK